MDDVFARFIDNLTSRVSGPMHFRLLIQPIVASIFAVKSGLADARAGRPLYFWALFTDPANRAAMLKDGWASVGKVFVAALVLDAVYQIIVNRFVYPGEAIVTAVVLAFIPYLMMRGLVTRIARGK